MAALYGRLQGNRGEATRTGSKDSGINATLETWEGKVKVDLDSDGTFSVSIGTKYGSLIPVATGNVDRLTFEDISRTILKGKQGTTN